MSWFTAQVGAREAARVLHATTPAPCPILAAFDREQYWRARGELAIRAEMAQRVATRLRSRAK